MMTKYFMSFIILSLYISVIGAFGLTGNFLNIIVLNSKELRSNCFNNLLTSLNIMER